MPTPIENNKYYHIYNRGNNYQDIFIDTDDYLHFLNLTDIYLAPVAEIYAWALLKNHFHILLRIKSANEIGYLNPDYAKSDDAALKWKTFFPTKPDPKFRKKPNPSSMLSHLFDAYARRFNNKHQQAGSLFISRFKRKWVDTEKYYTNLVVYIHNNPVKHGFTRHILDYPWTSHLLLKESRKTITNNRQLINLFGGLENYTYAHQQQQDETEIEKYLIEE